MKHRRLGTSAAALALALLAGCGGTLGMQPTVESEVVAPTADGAAAAIAAAARPDYEARIMTDFAGSSARMPDDQRSRPPADGALTPDQAAETAAELLWAGGAGTRGEWTLRYYPDKLTETVGAAPIYELELVPEGAAQGRGRMLWLETDGRLIYYLDTEEMGGVVAEMQAVLTARQGADYAAWAAERNRWVLQEAEGWLQDWLDQAGWGETRLTLTPGTEIPPDAAARDEALHRPYALARALPMQVQAVDEQGVDWVIRLDPLSPRVTMVQRRSDLGENLSFDEEGRLTGEGVTPLYRAVAEGWWRP